MIFLLLFLSSVILMIDRMAMMLKYCVAWQGQSHG